MNICCHTFGPHRGTNRDISWSVPVLTGSYKCGTLDVGIL